MHEWLDWCFQRPITTYGKFTNDWEIQRACMTYYIPYLVLLYIILASDAFRSPFGRLKLSLSMETKERLGVQGTFPALNILEG